VLSIEVNHFNAYFKIVHVPLLININIRERVSTSTVNILRVGSTDYYYLWLERVCLLLVLIKIDSLIQFNGIRVLKKPFDNSFVQFLTRFA